MAGFFILPLFKISAELYQLFVNLNLYEKESIVCDQECLPLPCEIIGYKMMRPGEEPCPQEITLCIQEGESWRFFRAKPIFLEKGERSEQRKILTVLY